MELVSGYASDGSDGSPARTQTDTPEAGGSEARIMDKSQGPARKKVKIVVDELLDDDLEEDGDDDDDDKDGRPTMGSGSISASGLFSRLPKPVNAKPSANTSSLARKPEAAPLAKQSLPFFTLASKTDLKRPTIPEPVVGPQRAQNSGSSAYAIAAGHVNSSSRVADVASRLDDDTRDALAVLPKKEKRQIEMVDGIDIIDVNQEDLSKIKDQDPQFSLTQREIANATAESLAAAAAAQGDNGAKSGSLLAMAQEAARTELELQERASIRRSNQMRTQRKYGW